MADELNTDTNPQADPATSAIANDDATPDDKGAEADKIGDSAPPEPSVNTDVKGAEPTEAEKRIKQLVAKAHEAERQAAYYKGLAEGGKKPEETVPETANAKPNPEQFKNYDDYVEALADWKATEKVNVMLEAREKAGRVEAERKTISQRIAKGEEKYADFREVIMNPSLSITDVMLEVIRSVDDGIDIAYFLGKNPAEAARIAALPPYMAVMELGTIRTRLSAVSEPRRVTQAPVPITTVTGTAQTGTPPEEMSVDDWMKWRESTLQH